MCMQQQPSVPTGVTPGSQLSGVVPSSIAGPQAPSDDAPLWAKMIQAGGQGAIKGYLQSQQPVQQNQKQQSMRPQQQAQPTAGAIPSLAQSIMANYLKNVSGANS